MGAHVELFAGSHVILVPAGIGIAPPRATAGAYVSGGRCSYALRTTEPTGVIEIVPGTRATLGDLFDVWGASLSARELAGFRAPLGARVRVYVAGLRRVGDPRLIRLTRHAQIVLELGAFIPPHRTYRFAPGL